MAPKENWKLDPQEENLDPNKSVPSKKYPSSSFLRDFYSR